MPASGVTSCELVAPIANIPAVSGRDPAAAYHAANAARRLAHAILLVRHGMDPAEVAETTGIDLKELLPHALPPGAWDAQQPKDNGSK